MLSISSCIREEMPGSSLRIVFETGAMDTKAVGNGNVADGGGIYLSGDGTELNPYLPDLVVLVFDTSTEARAGIFNGLSRPYSNCTLEGTPTGTQMSVAFSSLTENKNYTVYAFANTQGLWTMKSGGSTIESLSELTTISQVEALRFEPAAGDLESDGSLKVKNSRLPLSAKGTVTLTASGNGEISLALRRCVAKVTAVFENQYGRNLTLSDFSNTFTKMLPATGYVVPHEDDFPVARADASDLTASQSEIVIANNDLDSKSWYVFPSVGPYTCDVSFNFDSDQNGTPEAYTYTHLPVHDDHARDITQLARNQHLTITTRIGKGQRVSFYFEVADWSTKTEPVKFD